MTGLLQKKKYVRKENSFMQGKTHNMVGIACALGAAEIASMGTLSPETMVLAAAAGSFGGLIPDIDVKHSKARKQLYKVILTLVCTIAFLSISISACAE